MEKRRFLRVHRRRDNPDSVKGSSAPGAQRTIPNKRFLACVAFRQASCVLAGAACAVGATASARRAVQVRGAMEPVHIGAVYSAEPGLGGAVGVDGSAALMRQLRRYRAEPGPGRCNDECQDPSIDDGTVLGFADTTWARTGSGRRERRFSLELLHLGKCS